MAAFEEIKGCIEGILARHGSAILGIRWGIAVDSDMAYCQIMVPYRSQSKLMVFWAELEASFKLFRLQKKLHRPLVISFVASPGVDSA
jgi:hypothetical protein